MVAAAMFESDEIIRACVTNGESSEYDIDELVTALHTAGK